MKRVLVHNRLFQGLHDKMLLLRGGIKCCYTWLDKWWLNPILLLHIGEMNCWLLLMYLTKYPLKFVSFTPYELWNNRKLDPSNLQPRRLVDYVHNISHKYRKLGHRGRKCIFIRYSEHSKGYVFIGEHEDGIVTELESRDVTFLEDDFPHTD